MSAKDTLSSEPTELEIEKSKLQELGPRQILIDLLAATGASFFVSPFVTTIDKAVVEYASGKAPSIKQGLISGWKLLFTNPLQYYRKKEFLLVWGVYTLTFFAANAATTYAVKNDKPKEGYRFLSTVCVNIPGSVFQDKCYTQWFGKIKTGIPLMTYGCFTVRDMMTCATSFSLPIIIAKAFCISEVGVTLVLPAAVQFISSPLHLMGLDLYNRPNVGPIDRKQFITKNYLKTTAARIGRIGPTFGIGSNLNTYMRKGISNRVFTGIQS